MRAPCSSPSSAPRLSGRALCSFPGAPSSGSAPRRDCSCAGMSSPNPAGPSRHCWAATSTRQVAAPAMSSTRLPPAATLAPQASTGPRMRTRRGRRASLVRPARSPISPRPCCAGHARPAATCRRAARTARGASWRRLASSPRRASRALWRLARLVRWRRSRGRAHAESARWGPIARQMGVKPWRCRGVSVCHPATSECAGFPRLASARASARSALATRSWAATPAPPATRAARGP
mmetsp:Transcript_100128/g.289084  ORF Transcript_100128/g.289084 Transcript_100128/m.289084 type:complete len:236 (-) Transcript_100128:940-1647(-)